ncbi:hypothetical protein CJJ07_004697 [Candidozyma auris]|nr:hypothetical protein CJJ07_004697 [[Candida] auris]QEL60680.1 hypothetical protein CJJ09_002796 [[Candida] auris]
MIKEKPSDSPLLRTEPVVSTNHRVFLVVFLAFCSVLSLVECISPFLQELYKPDDISNAGSVMAWLLFYVAATCRLDEPYGFKSVMNCGLVLCGIRAILEAASLATGSKSLFEVTSFLSTVGGTYAFPNANFLLGKYCPRFSWLVTYCTYALAVFATVKFSSIAQHPLTYPVFALLCLVSAFLSHSTVPNGPVQPVSVKTIYHLAGVAGLAALRYIWVLYSTYSPGSLWYYLRAVAITIGVFGCEWLVFR